VVSEGVTALGTTEYELLAERISEYRVCLLAIEEELLDALDSLAKEVPEPAPAQE
jgi:hypothetical protein